MLAAVHRRRILDINRYSIFTLRPWNGMKPKLHLRPRAALWADKRQSFPTCSIAITAQRQIYRGIQRACVVSCTHPPAVSFPRASVLTARGKELLRIDHIAARVWVIVAVKPSPGLIHLINMHPPPLIHVLPPFAKLTWISARASTSLNPKA